MVKETNSFIKLELIRNIMQFFLFNLELKIAFNSFTAFANIAHYIFISIHSTYSRFNKVGTKNVNTHNYILKPNKKIL